MAQKLSQKQGRDAALMYEEMFGYQQKLVAFTDAKCQFSRDIETCALELLYYTNRQRAILQKMTRCHDVCLQG